MCIHPSIGPSVHSSICHYYDFIYCWQLWLISGLSTSQKFGGLIPAFSSLDVSMSKILIPKLLPTVLSLCILVLKGLCTLSPFFPGAYLKSVILNETFRTETLHRVWCICFSTHRENLQYETKCSGQAVRMILWLSLLGKKKERKKERKYRVHPTLKPRPADKGAAELSRSLPGIFQDVGGPVWYTASYIGTAHSKDDHQFPQTDWSWTVAGSLFEVGTHTETLFLSPTTLSVIWTDVKKHRKFNLSGKK